MPLEKATVSQWLVNPLVWIGLVALVFGIGRWVGNVNSDRKSFKEFMNEVRDDIKKILDRLPPPLPVTAGSPLTLTDLGRQISQRLSAGALADDLVPVLRERTKGKDPYEIQELCFAYVRDGYEPPQELEVLIRRCAYENALKREQVLDVLAAVELRDRLLPPD